MYRLLKGALRAAGKPAPPAGEPAANADQQPAKAAGHGRNGVADYPGAEHIAVTHETLAAGQRCPECNTGKLYPMAEPATTIRFTGQAPIAVTVWEMERLRCNLCGKVFTAPLPEAARGPKADAPAGAMVALLKYGAGVPFYRLAGLQADLGLPLAASTQWEIVEAVADRIHPVLRELRRQAAQGEVLHNDDTTMKILALMKKEGAAGAEVKNDPGAAEASQAPGASGESAQIAPSGEPPGGAGKLKPERKGVFTSAILSRVGERTIALFATGRRHAGENLGRILEQRDGALAPPIQMCDALSRNPPKDFEVILAHCLAHGRRKFVEVAEAFPEECLYVLESLGEVYHQDARCRELGLTAPARLAHHQRHSKPVMEELHQWLREQLQGKRVEPASSLGQAIKYMLKHWSELTLFLRKAGCPLDNNLCEQALKRFILLRKNSMFFKTEHGAAVGDLFLSLIHTCRLGKVNPLDYLTELQRHSAEVFKAPAAWLPWNYRDTLASIKQTESH